jgi:hypothetical protein
MSVIRKYDVLPSTENKGITIRAPFADNPSKQALEQHLVEVERTKKIHLNRMADYQTRDIHVVTPDAGLTLVGPSSPEGGSPTALAHNAAMVSLFVLRATNMHGGSASSMRRSWRR